MPAIGPSTPSICLLQTIKRRRREFKGDVMHSLEIPDRKQKAEHNKYKDPEFL